MAVVESATDQSWAVTLVDRFAQVEAVGREQELDHQEACSMEDIVAASVVAEAGACRSWEPGVLEACSMGDTVTASAVDVAVVVDTAVAAAVVRAWELEAYSMGDTTDESAVVVVAAAVVEPDPLEEACSMRDREPASAAVVADVDVAAWIAPEVVGTTESQIQGHSIRYWEVVPVHSVASIRGTDGVTKKVPVDVVGLGHS